MKEDAKKAGIMLTMLIAGIVILALCDNDSDNLSRTMCGFGTGLIVGGITYYANNLDRVNKKAVWWLVVVGLNFCISMVFGLLVYGLKHNYDLKTIVLASIFIVSLLLLLWILPVRSLRKIYKED